MKQPEPFIGHILEAINSIEKYVKGVSFSAFEEDEKTQDAVIRKLEIIGEASSKLENNFIKLHPDIPWREIKDFRNKLIHDYWELEIDLIWNVATKEILELKTKLLKIF